MRSPRCTICDARTTHQSELWPTLWLCSHCRIQFLRALLHRGVPLANNPIVFELCTGTSYAESESHSFYYEDSKGDYRLYRIHHDRLLIKVASLESQIYFEEDLDNLI